MVGCFNIAASLDHLDDGCVVVAGSVHVLGQCAKWSFQQEIKAYIHFELVRGISLFCSPFHILMHTVINWQLKIYARASICAGVRRLP